MMRRWCHPRPWLRVADMSDTRVVLVRACLVIGALLGLIAMMR